MCRWMLCRAGQPDLSWPLQTPLEYCPFLGLALGQGRWKSRKLIKYIENLSYDDSLKKKKKSSLLCYQKGT